jgi:hypothetical protein
MTENSDDPGPGPEPPGAGSDEELASAYLDGEATADEVRRVESDPMLLALVDRMRRVGHELRSITPAAANVRDDQISRAVDEFVEQKQPARVVTLRARRRRLGTAAVAAVAAVAAAIVGLVVIPSLRDTSSRDQAASVASSISESSSTISPNALSGDARSQTPQAAESFATNTPTTDLGAFASAAAARTRVDAMATLDNKLDTTSTTTGAAAPSATAPAGSAAGNIPTPACIASVEGSVAGLGSLRQILTFSVPEGPRAALVFGLEPTTDGGSRLHLVEVSLPACTVLRDVPLGDN